MRRAFLAFSQWSRVPTFWRKLRFRFHAKRTTPLGYTRFTRFLTVESTSEAIRASRPGVAVLVQSSGQDRWLRFQCPDGCGEPIMLNLSPARRPRWRIVVWRDEISVYPSVVNFRCGAHFLIRAGKIIEVGPISRSEDVRSLAPHEPAREGSARRGTP